jgi:hypothetical protein
LHEVLVVLEQIGDRWTRRRRCRSSLFKETVEQRPSGAVVRVVMEVSSFKMRPCA